MEAFIGMIMPFAGNFAPVGWALCNGQLLNINQNAALFSILGTMYGGNGSTNFGLPNLNGRAIVGAGQLQGGGTYQVGQSGGAENVTLSTNQLPAHTHALQASTTKGSAPQATGNLLGGSGGADLYTPASSGANAPMAPASISSVGGGQSVPTTTPYQCVTYIICTQGLFPTRS